jgi:hypothetical protein
VESTTAHPSYFGNGIFRNAILDSDFRTGPLNDYGASCKMPEINLSYPAVFCSFDGNPCPTMILVFRIVFVII